MKPPSADSPGSLNRRTFLADTGMGFTGMALSAMLFNEGKVSAAAHDAHGVGAHECAGLRPDRQRID